MDLSYVIITWNDAGRLPRALASAALAGAASRLDYEILVVDNGSTDHTGPVLDAFARELGPRLKVIRLGRNHGTTQSRNLAFARAQGRYLVVMDSDAEILDMDLRPALKLLDDFPEVGIVAPRIILPDGRTYDSAKLLPTLTDKLLKLPGLFTGRPTINRDWYPGFPFPGLRCVHTAISCAWLLRRDLVERIGPLDERIFYAPEDVDYCLRAWRAGQAVVWFPFLRVLHHTRQTSHRRPLSRIALSHLWGLLYYYRKHGYWLDRKRAAARWIDGLATRLDPRLAAWQREHLDA